jgi:hypothetical protein
MVVCVSPFLVKGKFFDIGCPRDLDSAAQFRINPPAGGLRVKVSEIFPNRGSYCEPKERIIFPSDEALYQSPHDETGLP